MGTAETAPSTANYSLGRGVLSINEWSGTTPPGGAYTDLGNAAEVEVEVSEEVLDHFTTRSGIKRVDKRVTLQAGYTVNFILDEIAVANLCYYLKGTMSGSNIIQANTQLDLEVALRFVSANPVGPDEQWDFWRCQLTPNGAMPLISDDWQALPFTATGLDDTTNHADSPYFTVTYETTTTTTT